MSEEHRQLTREDIIQAGDQYWGCGEWRDYSEHWYGQAVRIDMSRRPIAKAAKQPQIQPITYEEVPGSRTTQQAIDQPQRERIAYEELQPGDVIQEGDEWRNEDGRWQPFTSLTGSRVQVRHTQRARRPHNITQMENERAEAIAEVAKLSAELWARKPLEDRVASLTDELAQAREASQQLLKTITDNADTFVDQVAVVERERDEARAERDRLQEVVGNLYNEPTARQVQDMLRTWATELDWSAGCFDSAGRDEIDTIQKTLIAVIERIETIVNPEGGSDDN